MTKPRILSVVLQKALVFLREDTRPKIETGNESPAKEIKVPRTLSEFEETLPNIHAERIERKE